MRISEVRVKAAATVPTVMYGNVRPEVELSATLADGDDPSECVVWLQKRANELLLLHISSLREATC